MKLVGLPFTCSAENILQFLTSLRVRPGGVHFMTRQGKPTGKCVVEMEDAVEALRAVKQAHHKWLHQRYIEVYLARPCDLFCDPDELKVRRPSCLSASESERLRMGRTTWVNGGPSHAPCTTIGTRTSPSSMFLFLTPHYGIAHDTCTNADIIAHLHNTREPHVPVLVAVFLRCVLYVAPFRIR